MKKLPNVTFVIPVRIDSPERSRNLDVLIDFFIRNFDSNILIMEADSCQRYFVKNDNRRVQYFFEEDHRPVFQHTLYLNRLYRKVDTPIIAGWDTDIWVSPNQITNTVEQICSGNAVMGLPYDGHVYKTTDELANLYRETLNSDVLIQNSSDLKLMYGDLSVGGCFIVDTEKYLRAGGENEFFLGWGPEDFERVKRMEILYPQSIYRSVGCMFHLCHPRFLNSWYANQEYEINGKKEFLKVCGMDETELCDYIKTWPWLDGLQKHKNYFFS
jgi:predicted glycosyltransferase involved in capsule biosynthesis